MTKSLISNPAFLEQTDNTTHVGFNFVPVVNNFNSVFEPKPLGSEEEARIQKILFENFQLSNDSEERENEKLSEDFQEIKTITAEIKAIHKQSLVLMGERLHKARIIFKTYREGTFTLWLKETFKSKQTGYNILAYYEFYTALPSLELKEIFKSLPQKAAYVLASRQGNLEDKINILIDPSFSQAENLLPFIREKLPLLDNDKRKTKMSKILLLDMLCKNVEAIHVNKGNLPADVIEKLKLLKILIDDILTQ